MDQVLYDKLTGSNTSAPYPPSRLELIRQLDHHLAANSSIYSRILFGDVVNVTSDSCLAPSAAGRIVQNEQEPYMLRTGDDDENLDNWPAEYRPAQRGKPCGHVFKKGEGVHRCRDCALDSTCVFCDRCFNASNHEGHDTSFSLSSSGGGCCDCGDPEAWKVPIDCRFHSPNISPSSTHLHDDNILEPLPLELLSSINKTIVTVTEFILQTFSYSYWKPYTPTDASRFQKVYAPGNPTDNETYALILWNDEVHSFQEVIEAVSEALQVTKDEGRRVAEAIDTEGRDVIYTGADKTILKQIAATISRINLDVTIQPHHFTLQEAVAGRCLEWLYQLLSRVTTSPVQIGHVSYQTAEPIIRIAICDVLCRTPIQPIGEMDDRYHLGPEGPPNLHNILPSPIRLDYVLLYDVKMWKSLRKILHELLIATLIVSGDEYKRAFAERFAACYTKLVENAITIDREVELSVIYLSVQLFTVPTVARHLALGTTVISDMLLFLYILFRASTGRDKVSRQRLHQVQCDIIDEALTSQSIFPPSILPANSYTLKHSRTYAQVMHDISYLLSTKAVRMELFQSTPPVIELSRFLKVFALGQGIDPQTRAIAQHVEFEADDWVNAFNLSLKFSQLLPYVAGCFAPFDRTITSSLEQGLAQTTVMILSPSTQSWEADGVKWSLVDNEGSAPYIIPRYQVSTRPVSLHHPLHWFLSLLIAYLPTSSKYSGSSLFDILTRSFPPPDDPCYSVLVGFDTVMVSKMEVLSLLYEEPLRTIAMLTQIQAGLWIRNGYMLRAQAYHYEELELREDGHDQDILLLQTALVTLGADRFLMQALHRFELWEWLIVRQNTVLPTGFDRTKLGAITEGFLRMLIILLTERALCCLGLGQVAVEYEIRREMIHHLAAAASGLPHSAVIARIPDRLTDPHQLNDGMYAAPGKSVDDILAEVANFKYPGGVTDQGMYELKSQYYDLIDPWFWHYNREQRQKIEEVLKQRAAANKLRRRYLTIPHMAPIPFESAFSSLPLATTSKIFLKLLVHCIEMTTSPPTVGSRARPFRNENIFASTLHLVMIALSDRTRGTFSERAATLLISPTPNSLAITLVDQILSLAENCGVGTSSNSSKFMQSQQDEFCDQLGRLEWIVDQFSETLPAKIGLWRDRIEAEAASRSNDATFDGKGGEGDGGTKSETERKKQVAKAHQASIMAQFAKQQQSFMEKHASQMGDEEDGEPSVLRNSSSSSSAAPHLASQLEEQEERVYEYPKDVCIVCQESAASRLYGTLCLLQKSSVLRQVNFDDVDNVVQVLTKVGKSLDSGPSDAIALDTVSPAASPFMRNRSNSSLSTSNNLQTSSHTASKPFQQVDTRFSETGFFMSTCGHLMHVDCFQDYTQSIRIRHNNAHMRRLEPEDLEQGEFLCPLCKTLGNCLIPIAFPECKEKVLWAFEQAVDGQSFEARLEQWWHAHRDTITQSLTGMPTQLPDRINMDSLPTNALSWLSSARAASSSLLTRLSGILGARKSDSGQMDLHDALATHYFKHLIPRAWDRLYDTAEEPDLDASDLMLLPETIYYTIAALELASRNLPPPQLDGFRTDKYKTKRIHRIGVIDALTSNQIMLLRQLCSTHDMIAEFMAQRHGAAQNPAVMARRALHALLEGVLGAYQWNDECGWEDQDGREFEKEVWTATHGGFWHVVGMSLFLRSSDIFGEDPRIMVGLAYVREIVRCCSVIATSVLVKRQPWIHNVNVASTLNSDSGNSNSTDEMDVTNPALKFMAWLAGYLFDDTRLGDRWKTTRVAQMNPVVVIALLERIMLVFLRRTAILLDARFKLMPAGGSNGFGLDKVDITQVSDMDFDEDTFESADNEKSELERLLLYLGLPPIRDIFTLLTKDLDNGNNTGLIRKLVEGWCMQIKQASRRRNDMEKMDEDQVEEGVVVSGGTEETVTIMSHRDSSSAAENTVTSTMEVDTATSEDAEDQLSTMSLPSPSPFTLISLPFRGEALLQESIRRVCPQCKTVPPEPAICLLCGATICVQSMCCMDDQNRGECNQHIIECGKDVGVFLIMKRAAIMVLRSNGRGCMLNSPYLDAHGEEDPGLRRGKPVFLNPRRYEELRKMVINHNLSNHVSKRLEQIYDAGGWINM
ncbi:hypothetical protein SeLEV6574_g03322 [Synchytrium endobioticum]|uniref:E3 ubiquitin-protein ligase n=1 Tax=Synchytrium endobioticum TaxID=286115 RepID=A0A507D4B0_9FUNG|nr:hypothetical protein SeLEV6574_g03322 [Synchytrium endobioticum]